MGNNVGGVSSYAAEISASRDSSLETGVFRSVESLKKVLDIPTGMESSWQMFDATVKSHGSSAFLGHRPLDAAGNLSEYKWITYKQGKQRALTVGSFLVEKNLCPLSNFDDEQYAPARALRTLGIFLTNSPEWFVTEFAAASQDITIVPLYETLGEESMNYIVDLSKLSTMLVSNSTFPSALKACRACPNLQNLIVVGELTMEQQIEAKELGVTIFKWADVLATPVTAPINPPKSADSINTICFTSGTTGMPKGVLITNRNVVACANATHSHGPLSKGEELGIDQNDVHISYLPLAHVFERLVCSTCIHVGAAIGCFSGNMLKLMDDVAVMNPTVFISVPRLFNRINDKISAGVTQKSMIIQSLFEWGLNSKINKFKNTASTTSTIWDKVVFGSFKGLLGNRLRFMVSGGAPLDQSVHERIQACFCAPLLQGYGMSETFGPSFLCSDGDTVLGHVGGVYPSVEFKLESVAELGYVVDAEVPKGELFIRGTSVTAGYFRNPEANLEHFKDGWLRTGDICALLPSNGVKIIDRRKNLFKLAQGEYVAPEKCENAMGNSSYVNQIFVHGESNESFLVAVVVADHDKAKLWASSQGIAETDVKTIIKMPEFKKEVLRDMNTVAINSALMGFEKIKNCHIIYSEFTVENNMLTPTSKLKRPIAKSHFATELAKLYTEGVFQF